MEEFTFLDTVVINGETRLVLQDNYSEEDIVRQVKSFAKYYGYINNPVFLFLISKLNYKNQKPVDFKDLAKKHDPFLDMHIAKLEIFEKLPDDVIRDVVLKIMKFSVMFEVAFNKQKGITHRELNDIIRDLEISELDYATVGSVMTSYDGFDVMRFINKFVTREDKLKLMLEYPIDMDDEPLAVKIHRGLNVLRTHFGTDNEILF